MAATICLDQKQLAVLKLSIETCFLAWKESVFRKSSRKQDDKGQIHEVKLDAPLTLCSPKQFHSKAIFFI